MSKSICELALIAMYIFRGCDLINESERDTSNLIDHSAQEQIIEKRNEFAIYLTAMKITPEQMSGVELNELIIDENPILSVDDIVSYTKASHEIEVTVSVYERINRIEVGVYGTVFVVCVGRNPIYWGAFWTPVSSIPFDGAVILLEKPISADRHVIRIQLGYPTEKYFSGEDPRANEKILKSLKQSGKLK